MLTYSIEKSRSVPLYEGLAEAIRQDIASGKIASGERLPSKRALAKNLGLSVMTVERAYEELEDEGFVVPSPRRGFFAACPGPRGVPKAPRATSPVRKSERQLLADFAGSGTEPEAFPFDAWSRIMRRELRENRAALLGKQPAGGALPLRIEIARLLADFHGIEASPDRIVIGAGTEFLYGIALQLLGSGRRYALEDPGYGPAAAVWRNFGARVSFIPIDRKGMPPDLLRASGADTVHVTPSHHFPSGAVMPISRRYELLGWASDAPGRFVIEDDYDSEMRLFGRPLPALVSLDRADRVLYMNTFSKTLASSIRISWMVLPDELAERFSEKLAYYRCPVPAFEQYTLAEFLRLGYFERHLHRMREDYRRKQASLLELIRKDPVLGKGEILNSGEGLHFVLRLPPRKGTEEDAVKRAAASGVRVRPLSSFYEGTVPNEARNCFVLSYSPVPAESFGPAVRALSAAFG